MVIYEVSVEVDQEIASEYRRWLTDHTADIVEKGRFERADVYTADGANPLVTNWVIQYRAKSLKAVQNYLEKLAPEFRADGLKRFGEKARAQRRILTLTEEHLPSQIGATHRKDVSMNTQVNWKKIRAEFERLADVEKLKSEVQRIGSEIRGFDFHSVLSPAAQAKVKNFEKRYTEISRSLHQAQRQMDREFNRLLTQIKGQRKEVEKTAKEFQKRFTKKAAAAKATAKTSAKKATKKTAAKGTRKRAKA